MWTMAGGRDFGSIQDAIDASEDGDTVRVHDGLYLVYQEIQSYHYAIIIADAVLLGCLILHFYKKAITFYDQLSIHS